MPRTTTKPAAKRARRTPEEARALILAAAERTFAQHLPETVGLKDVAQEAGVSHALITHYFGTYDALVEATLEQRIAQVRHELLPRLVSSIGQGGSLLEVLAAQRAAVIEAASDPTTMRLVGWAILTGRAATGDFFPHRVQGLRLLADALATTTKASREDLEFVIIASFSLATTFAFGGHALAGALGRQPSRAAFDRHCDAMFAAFLERSRA